MSQADLQIIIGAKNESGTALTQLQAQLRDLQRAAGALGSGLKQTGAATVSAGQSAAAASAPFGKLGGYLLAGLGIGSGIAAFDTIKDQLGGMVTKAEEAEQVQAQLAAVLRSTGGAAGVTAGQATELASSLQLVTRYDDETVLGMENLLLTFTSIKGDHFEEATRAALDMSQALGQDLKSSAIQLGKALQDPERGITALRRVGVNFTDAQHDQIMAMMAAGDAAGAQTLILKELEKEFGGSAEAAGQTFAGQLDILGHKIDEIKEKAGAGLIPVLLQLVSAAGLFADQVSRGGAAPGESDLFGLADTLSGGLLGSGPDALEELRNIVATAKAAVAGRSRAESTTAGQDAFLAAQDPAAFDFHGADAFDKMANMLGRQGAALQGSTEFLLDNEIALSHHAAAEHADADAISHAAAALTEWHQAGREGSGDVGRAAGLIRDAAAEAADTRARALTMVGGYAGINDPDNNESARRRGAVYTPAEKAGQDQIIQGLRDNAKDWEEYEKKKKEITDSNAKEAAREAKQAAAEQAREADRQAKEAARQADQAFSREQGAQRLGISNSALYDEIAAMTQPAKDKAALDKEIQQVERDRMSTQLDLAQAQRDGDDAGAARLRERLGLLDAEIARREKLGTLEGERGSASWWKGLSKEEQAWRKQMGDVYGIYGGGPAAAAQNLPPIPTVAQIMTTEDAKAHTLLGGIDDKLADLVQLTASRSGDSGGGIDSLGFLAAEIKRKRAAMPALAPA